MAAENCNIQPGDTVAVWGSGPVGLLAMKSAFMLGAERVIGIDRVVSRLRKAADDCCAETINYERVNVVEALNEMTGGRGPDSCIDAVGMESHGTGIEHLYDRAKQVTCASSALREGGGTVVRVALQYNPPAGKLGAALSTVLGEKPSSLIEEALRKFKQLMEAGEVATASEGKKIPHSTEPVEAASED